MNGKSHNKFDLKEFLKPLEEQLQNSNPDFEDFEKAYKELTHTQSKLQELLEYAGQIRSKEKDRFQKLHKKLAGENASVLVDKLGGLGFKYRKEQVFDDALEGQVYRLLEQTRAGNRHNVFHGLLRIFVSHKQRFPKRLVEPFKPVYSDEIFKVLMFSFLSRILGKGKAEQTGEDSQ